MTACAPSRQPHPQPERSASQQPSPSATPSGPSCQRDASVCRRRRDRRSGGTTYTVQGGDTLSSIARAWGTSVAQLQAWNAVAYPSLVHRPEHARGGLDPDRGRATRGRRRCPPPRRPPRPTPSATGCRAGNRVAAGAQQTFTTVPNAGHGVALTLDMGGRLEPGIDILNLLIANKVCATIFPTGAMAQTAQGQQVMAVIKAHPELFEIGNHTMHHCNLVSGGGGSPTTAPCAGVTPTADFIRKELTDAAAILAQFSGQQPVPYWRPPYGVGEPGGARRGGIGRVHQDLHVGHRHDRLEADRRRRPDRRSRSPPR